MNYKEYSKSLCCSLANFKLLLFWILKWVFCYLNLRIGLALITMDGARLWTDGRYFLQATQELTDQWTLMRMGEDPAVDVWMADVSLSTVKLATECLWVLYH